MTNNMSAQKHQYNLFSKEPFTQNNCSGTLSKKNYGLIWEFFPYGGGGVFPIPKTFVNWPSIFCTPNSFWGAKTCFTKGGVVISDQFYHLKFIWFRSFRGKNTEFWEFGKWGGHLLSFASLLLVELFVVNQREGGWKSVIYCDRRKSGTPAPSMRLTLVSFNHQLIMAPLKHNNLLEWYVAAFIFLGQNIFGNNSHLCPLWWRDEVPFGCSVSVECWVLSVGYCDCTGVPFQWQCECECWRVGTWNKKEVISPSCLFRVSSVPAPDLQ